MTSYKQVQQKDDWEDDGDSIMGVLLLDPVDGGTIVTPIKSKKDTTTANDNITTPTGDHDPSSTSCWNVTRCAGCVGATVGCLTSGFCLSTICGIGCMYYAAGDEKGVGRDMARACGSVGVQANVMIRDFGEEHHLLEHCQRVGVTVWNQTKQWNEEYHVVESTKNCLVSTAKAGIKFTQEHKIVERSIKGVGNVLSVVAKEVVSDRNTAAKQAVEAFSDPEIYATEEVETERNGESETIDNINASEAV